jgi:O-antigen/teichoic acid export membrane protein
MAEATQTGNQPVSFIRDIVWIGISQALTSILGLIILPVLTKTYTPEIYGVWTQINVTVTLISPVINLQLSTAVIRFLAGESDKERRRRALGAMILAIIIAVGLILVISNFFVPQLSSFLFADPAYTTFVRLLLLWIIGDAFFVFFVGNLRARGMIKGIAVIQTSISVLKLLLIVILTKSGFGIQWIVTSNLCIEYLFAITIFGFVVRKDGFPFPNFSRIREYLAFSLPQVPVGILTWVMGMSDRYFITHFLDLAQTGIYSSSSILAALVTLFYTPVGFVLYPVVSKTWEENKKNETKHYFELSTRIFLILAIPSAVGIALLSQPLLKFLATSEYMAGAGLVMLMSLSQLFAGLFSLNVYVVYLIKKTKWLPFLTLVSAGISAGLNYLFIPPFGIFGAAVSKVVAYFILVVIVTVWAKKVIDYNINFRSVTKIIGATLAMALGMYFYKVHSVWEIAIAVIIGMAIYGFMIFILRSISAEEKAYIKKTLSKATPRIFRKKRTDDSGTL